MFLPTSIDLTPDDELLEPAEIGEPGYGENIEYSLSITVNRTGAHIDYYGEDDSYLSDEKVQEVILKHNPEFRWII